MTVVLGMASVRRIALIGTIALGIVCVAGCEKRVISSHMVPATGMATSTDYHYIRATPPQPKRGMLEGIGDMLFGWTDGLFSDKTASSSTDGRSPVSSSQWSPGRWQTQSSTQSSSTPSTPPTSR